jgi:hypothetical protein
MGRFQRDKLAIEQYDGLLAEHLAPEMRGLLDRSVPGLVTYSDEIGWSLTPPA